MHRSVIQQQARARGIRLRPHNMSTVTLADDQREAVESIALGIFTDMTNAGASLQATLAAVYLSGIAHAMGATTP
jgi:hypothetical protein